MSNADHLKAYLDLLKIIIIALLGAYLVFFNNFMAKRELSDCSISVINAIFIIGLLFFVGLWVLLHKQGKCAMWWKRFYRPHKLFLWSKVSHFYPTCKSKILGREKGKELRIFSSEKSNSPCKLMCCQVMMEPCLILEISIFCSSSVFTSASFWEMWR